MMFISKFNALIRNRIVWGVIAFVVVMAFVVWGVQTGGERESSAAENVGMLDGKPVKREDFEGAYFSSYLSLCLSLGRRMNVSGDMDVFLRRMAWKRLVSLRAAESMGLPAGKDEVASAICEQPLFTIDGRFSPERYQAFVHGFLGELGATEPQFEEFIRQEIALNKVKYFLAQAAWITSEEVVRIFHRLYDKFTVQYVALRRDELEHHVPMDDEAARLLFASNPEAFRIPEQVKVKFVCFPTENFLDADSVGDEVLWEYYDKFIESASEFGDGDFDDIPPFEDVKEELRAAAAADQAALQARDSASAFEIMLAPDRHGRAPSFDDAAVSLGLAVTTTGFFSVDSKVEGLDVGLDFNRAAFELRPTADEYFSYPVGGESGYYVMGLLDRRDSRIPEFDEVREDALLAAREKAVADMLKDLASTVRASIAEDIDNGVSFEDSAAKFGLEALSLEPFTITAKLADYESSEESHMLLRHAIGCNAGELTDIIPVQDGFLLGYVAERESAARSIYDSIKNDLIGYVKQGMEETVFNEWQSYMLSASGFEDFSARRLAVPEDEEMEDDDGSEPAGPGSV